MVPTGQRLVRVALVVAAVALLPGCFGLSQNPSYFPYLHSTGDIIRTHAKPKGHGYFANFDPHAVRVEVRPLDSTGPVRAQHVLIATVYDEKGRPRRNRRVEWVLHGVGEILEVDESGHLPGRGYKVDNKYAVSYTDYHENRITRGTDDPADDFMIRPGQSWCVVSSPVEGDTVVTVYCPEIHNWQARKVEVTKHWVDAEYQLPPPATNRLGTEHVLTTNVFRHTDRAPLAGYRVRYRILDGPPAVFLPERATEKVVASDLSGNAVASLVQVTPQPGTNRIGVEVIRPPDPTTPSGTGIVIGSGTATKEWVGPAVAFDKTGPASAGVNQEITYTISLTNTGQVESEAQTVRDPIPEGLQYVRSQPPAQVDGNQLVWTLGTLPPGQAHTLQAVFRPTRVGPVTNCANVTTVEGFRAEKCVTTQVSQPGLRVAVAGPSSAAVGVPLQYQITVTNTGTGPASNVLLSVKLDPGLEHAERSDTVESRIPVLRAGEAQTIPLDVTPRRGGTFTTRVTATADGNLRDEALHTVAVQTPRLQVDLTGPKLRFVDKAADWKVVVTNRGDVPLDRVQVRDILPPELTFVSATRGGRLENGQVVWDLGRLPAGEAVELEVKTLAARVARQAVQQVVATSEPGIQEQASAVLEIQGLPAFAFDVDANPVPVETRGKVTYTITVKNTGSLAGTGVQVTAQLPPQMAYVNATGPAGAGAPAVQGQRVVFPALNGLQPRQVWTYTVEARADQEAKDTRFEALLQTDSFDRDKPVRKEASVPVVAPLNGVPAPPALPRP